MNYIKTFIFLGILTSLFIFIGYALGGSGGMIMALIFACVMNFTSYWFSDSIVLKMYGATVANPITNADFYQITKELTKNGNMPMPKLYIMDNPAPNAFATGRNPQHAAVAITTGLYNMLSKEELSGVIAHELAHIKNYDTLIGTSVATIAGAISMLSNIFMFASMFGGNRGNNQPHPIVAIALAILAPIVATIIQMTISRQREYVADNVGGKMCKNPLYLASALQKLEVFHKQNHGGGILNRSNKKPQSQKGYSRSDDVLDDGFNRTSTKSPTPATAHLFIINPLSNNSNTMNLGGNSDSLFSTHPNTQNRIKQLVLQAKNMGLEHKLHTANKAHDHNAEAQKLVNMIIDKNNPWL